MKKIVTVLGARPQFIKAAAISRTLRQHYSTVIQEIIVHTGQHYDENMSGIFFDQLNLPRPERNLQIGGKPNAVQIEEMIVALASTFHELNPDCVLVYGDTNSTHAAAVAAHRYDIPLIHIEAGLRSFNPQMPEEINRIIADKYATLLFVPTLQGMKNLENEGFSLHNVPPYNQSNPGVICCGDIMYDNALYYSSQSESLECLSRFNLEKKSYGLFTLHRDSNTDNAHRLNALIKALIEAVERYHLPIVWPQHPRTMKMMEQLLDFDLKEKLNQTKLIHCIPPASYLEMIAWESNAQLIITDSGGVQKEAFFFRKPAVIMRPETEWTELVENGNAVLVDADSQRMVQVIGEMLNRDDYTWPQFYGNGNAANTICATIANQWK